MRRTASVAVFLALASFARAQEPFTYAIDVRVINVDVVVTGRDGRPIENLTRESFRLFIDGRPAEIRYFSRIVEGRLDSVPEAEPAQTAAAPPPPADVPRTPVTWAIFVDQTNVRPAQRNAALRQLRSFLESAVHDGDHSVIGNFDGVAFRMRRGFAGRQALLAELARLEKERFHLGPAAQQRSLIRMEMNSIDPSDPMSAAMMAAIGLRIGALVDLEADRTRRAITAMRSLVDVLQGAEGRLAIVYLGGGFTTLPALDVVESYRQRAPELERGGQGPQPEMHQKNLERDVHLLYERIAATRAAVYAIYAGDGSPVTSPEEMGTMETAGGTAGDRAELTQIALAREIAERTGGLFFKTNPRLARQLQAVQTDLTHYYSLGYVPEGPAGRAGSVRVEVNVPGARVRYREKVRERTPEEQAADAVVAALFDPRQSNVLGVAVENDPPRSTRNGRVVAVRVKVPLDALTFLPDGEAQRAGLAFHFAIAAEDGTVWRLDSRELPLRIPRADLAKALSQKITYSVDVPLQRRGARLAVSVQDRIGMTRSLVTVPLDAKPEARP